MPSTPSRPPAKATTRLGERVTSPKQREAEALASAAGAKCKDCPFSVSGRPYGFVPAVGPSRSPKGVIVGESPGRMEVEQGEPFVGPTGQELNAALFDQRLMREDLLLINAIACKPKEPKTEADMRHAAQACQPLFWHQLRNVPVDTPTLMCGKWAVFACLGATKEIASYRGFPDFTWTLTRPLPKEE